MRQSIKSEKTSRAVPVVRAKPDCGFLPNASKHTKARKQAGLRLLLYQAELCLHIHQAEPYLLSPLGRAAITTIRRSCRAAGMCRPCGWGGGRFWRACRRGFCTERRFSAGGSSWACFGLQDKQSTKQIELGLPFSPSRSAASRQMRQSIQKQENKRDCVCIPVKPAVPVVRAKPDCGFLPNASKHKK